MQKVNKYKIDPQVVANLESLSYEAEARKSVITEMLAQNMDTSTDAFNKYQGEMTRFKAQFEQAKHLFQKQYVDSILGAVNWTLDYASCELSVTVCGDCCGQV